MYDVPCEDLTDAQKERLYLLIEEASEVQKQACKILRFGYPDIHPHTGKDNLSILHEELGDLETVIDLMVGCGDIKHREIQKQYPIKYEKLKKFTRYQNL